MSAVDRRALLASLGGLVGGIVILNRRDAEGAQRSEIDVDDDK